MDYVSLKVGLLLLDAWTGLTFGVGASLRLLVSKRHLPISPK